jgi:hypothetical protein
MSNHKLLQCIGNSVKGPCGWKGSLRSRTIYCPNCGARTKKVRTEITNNDDTGNSKKVSIKRMEKICVGKGSNPPCGWEGYNTRGILCPRCGGRIKNKSEIVTKIEKVEPIIEQPSETIVEQNIVDIDTKVETNDTEHPMEREIPTENP